MKQQKKYQKKIHKILVTILIFCVLGNVFVSPIHATSTSFSYTGAQQTWVVPNGVTSIIVDAKGAQGGASGGTGGRVITTVSTTPGETLYIYVGGSAGYNGGTDGGGGATDIRQGGTALANRIVVAGGGGGKGTDGSSYGGGAGGSGGGTTGGSGTAGALNGGLAGTGGTSSAGGTGASVRSGSYGTQAAGGGGGGYYGGGGGSGSTAGGNGSLGTGGTNGNSGGTNAYGGGGGGGGSSYSSGSNTTHTQGYQSGNGSISISYGSAPGTPSLDAPTQAATNQSLTPTLLTTATDADSDTLQYKIELCTDSGMTANCQTFDQTADTTGWSASNYASGAQASYTVQTSLTGNTTYYWRSYAYDTTITTWSGTQTPQSFTTQIGDCTSVPTSGNHSISTSCALSGSVNGVDTGSGSTNTAILEVTTNGNLSILPDQTIAVGSINLTGGTIIIWETGQLKPNTPLYVSDADHDGYPVNATSTQYTSAGVNCPGVNCDRARRGLSIDYDDTSASIYPGTTCNGTCSVNTTTGTCVAVSAGENSLAACTRCDGASLSAVNITNGTTDTEGSNTCNATHYVCNGSGSCTAPTTTSCVQRTAAPSGATCTAKCTAITNGVSCSSGYTNSGCSSGASACSNASTYCSCTVYTY